MEVRDRPPGTKLFISEDYVKGLEEENREKEELVELWKSCIQHTTDFLEILREHFDDFDRLLKEVNEASDDIEFVVDSEGQIKYRVNGSQES